MENYTLPEFEATPMNDQQIFTKIWTSPRVVMQYIHDKQYDKYATLLIFLAGISRALENASDKNLGESWSMWSILLMSGSIGGLFFIIGMYVYAALLSMTGKWLNGQGDTNSIYRVIGYSMLPNAVGLLLWLVMISFYGMDAFRDIEMVEVSHYGLYIVYYIIILLFIALGIWSLILGVVGIAVVQKFSLIKAFLSMILPGAILVTAILSAFLFVKMIS
jgi:hypothetical protein